MSDGSQQFSAEELHEIKKVFALVDRDGSGEIDAKELEQVIEKLTEEKPSKYALQQFIEEVDGRNKDGKKDGKIQWDEFMNALSEWVTRANAGSNKAQSRKRSRGPENDSAKDKRQRLHKKIAAFFVCFKQSSDFESIRSKFRALERKSTGVHSGIATDQHRTRTEIVTASEKEQKLKVIAEAAEKLHLLATQITGDDPNKAYAATWNLADMLSIVDILVTPEERFQNSDLIIKIFSRVKEMVLIPRIALFLRDISRPELQYHAARVLTYYANGPRIAHTPKDSAIHPDKMMHKWEVLKTGAWRTMTLLVKFSRAPKVKVQCVLALGEIASYHHEARNGLIEKGVYPQLLQVITKTTPVDILRPVTWALSVFSGHTHDIEKHPPNYRAISAGLERFVWIVNKVDDPETLLNTWCILSYLMPGNVVHKKVIQHLVRQLTYVPVELKRAPGETSSNVKMRVIRKEKMHTLRSLKLVLVRCLSDMIKLNTVSVKELISYRLLININKLITSSTQSEDFDVRLRSCELLGMLASERGCAHDIISANLIPSMVYLVVNDEFCRWKAVEVIKFCTMVQPEQMRLLITKVGLVKSLANSLSFFKTRDSVLTQVYNYYEPTFNFKFAEDVITALNNLLSICNPDNGLVNYFDFDLLEKLKAVMFLLVSSDKANDQIIAWAELRQNPIPLEKIIRNMMTKIQQMHAQSETSARKPISDFVTKTISDFNRVYSKYEQKMIKRKRQIERQRATADRKQGAGGRMNAMDTDASGKIKVKCIAETGDNKVLFAPYDVKLQQLMSLVQLKYSKPMLLRYADWDDTKITIDSQDLLDEALKGISNGELKIYPLPKFKDRSFQNNSNHSGSHQQGGGGNMDIRELISQTRFNKGDFNQLKKHYAKHAGGLNRALSKQQFVKCLGLVGKVSRDKADVIFKAFDTSGDGHVSFDEFVVRLSMLKKGDPEERIKMCFEAYDLNNDGSIDKTEFLNFLRVHNRSNGGVARSEQKLRDEVDEIFDSDDIDVDGDGKISLEEFKRAVFNQKIILDSFWLNEC